MNIAEAVIVKATPNPSRPGCVLVTVRCPYDCENEKPRPGPRRPRTSEHEHGVCDSHDLGRRVPHCHGGHNRDEYVLVDPSGLVAACQQRGAA